MTKILLVEDDDIVARVAIWRLGKLGYEVCGRATNSADALKITDEHHPDLILMDINIAGPIDGIATAKLLKEITQRRSYILRHRPMKRPLSGRLIPSREASFQNHLRIRIWIAIEIALRKK